MALSENIFAQVQENFSENHISGNDGEKRHFLQVFLVFDSCVG